MPIPTATPYRGDATTRQLKWLVILLIISNIAVGVFAVYALRQADKRYSDLVDRSVPVLNELQTLTVRGLQAMAATNPTHVHNIGAGGVAAAQAAINEDEALRRKLLAESWLTDDKPKRRELSAAGEAFTVGARAVTAAFEHNDPQGAATQRETVLRAAFDRYIDAITVAADELESESQRVNDLETEHIGSISRFVLGIAAWPVLAIVTLLLVTATFVLALMLLFRGREMNDAP
jgi:hypothetical protein